MGYTTTYTLEVKTGNTDLISELRATCDEAMYAIDDCGETEESCKWYDHEKDMKAFSKEHPEAVFKLAGIGEEQPDMWIKYFCNGRMQVCNAVITYDDYDYKKLK